MRHDLTGFDQVVLPEFELPWTAGLHPDVQATHLALVDWSESHGLLRDAAERERYAGYRFAWLAGRCFPRADRVFAQWAADFMLWFFLFDDVTADRVESNERATDMVRRLTAMLDTVDLDATGDRPLHGETAWLDLCHRLRELAPADENYQRWANAMRMWFLSLALQVFDQLCTKGVDPRSYTAYRQYSAGLKPPFAVVDLANAGPITSEEFHAPEARLLERYACNVVAWSNDVLSSPVEVHEPSTRSLVTVLKDAGPGRSWQDAVDLAVARTHAEIARFADLAAVVRRTAGPQMSGWIDGCQDWMAGTIAWSLRDSARYGRTAAAPLSPAPGTVG
ncbi:terpene synthase family protein [Streptomyces sp. NPDC021093]|uniref:terpene synthase family protein n=1 Tax=Streptomyces sp. NPDC021093 TaxID=3365112 RepID=UPI00379DBD22